MIRTLDALKLARTKLRTRKVRLTITLIIMSLLFAGLVFISLVTSGVVGSLKDFGKEGLGSRYLVTAYPMLYNTYGNNELLEQLRPAQKDLIAQKKQLAKNLGITYDEKTDTNLPINTQQIGPSPTDIEEYINESRPEAIAAIRQLNSSIPGVTMENFETLAQNQGAKNVYFSTNPNFNATFSNVSILVDGKENLNQDKNEFNGPPSGIKSIESQGWNQISDELLQPFVLKGQSTAVGSDGTIPIVAPYSAAQELLKLKKLPDTATSREKLERLEFVRNNIPEVRAQLCYRSESSQSLLQTALSQQKEININKGKKDYTPPSLQYNIPNEPCGAVTIKSDKRTTAEKKADDNQKQFDRAFNNYTDPVQGIMILRVVGITPDIEYDSSYSASSIFQGVFSSSIGYGWFSPASAIQPGTLVSTAQGGSIAERQLGNVNYYAEFSTLAEAKTFIKNNNCDINYEQGYDPNKQLDTCIANKTPFYVSAYGNNAGAIEDLQSTVWKISRFVILGVVIIAVVIMMGTLGKIIADSRRETAVFRALGAKRLDISQIYFTYTVIVSTMIALIAFIVGSVGAKIIDHLYREDLSVNAIITYNAADTSKEFALYGVNPLHMLLLLGLIIASGLVSAAIPLLTNMRRNPIRDMRDDS